MAADGAAGVALWECNNVKTIIFIYFWKHFVPENNFRGRSISPLIGNGEGDGVGRDPTNKTIWASAHRGKQQICFNMNYPFGRFPPLAVISAGCSDKQTFTWWSCSRVWLCWTSVRLVRHVFIDVLYKLRNPDNILILTRTKAFHKLPFRSSCGPSQTYQFRPSRSAATVMMCRLFMTSYYMAL